jgi:hypothetical protein
VDLELHNVYPVQVDGGVKIVANVVAVGYYDRTGDPFSCATSCWADVVAQWDDPSNTSDPKHLVKKFLIKEGIQSAKTALEQAKSYAAGELSQAQALPDADPDKAAKVLAAQTWIAQLTGFGHLVDVEITVRVNSFYSSMKTWYEGKGDADGAARIQAEWDAWTTAHPDTTGLEGAVLA